MGMSTDVIGFVSPDDETYKKHSKVLMACIEADIERLPKETAEYFGDTCPDESLLEEKLTTELQLHVFRNEYSNGFEILVSEIPEGVHKIRFVNSY